MLMVNDIDKLAQVKIKWWKYSGYTCGELVTRDRDYASWLVKSQLLKVNKEKRTVLYALRELLKST